MSGSGERIPIAAYTPAASSLNDCGGTSPGTEKQMVVNWSAVGLGVFLVSASAGLGVALDLLHKELERGRMVEEQVVEQLRTANHPGIWVSSDQVHNNCYADRTGVTCTFTNLAQVPVRTCQRGKLTNKNSPGMSLETVVMCTGRLAPTETRVVTAPWIGGFADDLCYKESSYGKTIDWSKCNFNNDPFEPVAPSKVAAK